MIWSVGLTMLGYALGSTIGNVDAYLLPAIGVIVVISLLPVAIELIRTKANAPTRDDEPVSPRDLSRRG